MKKLGKWLLGIIIGLAAISIIGYLWLNEPKPAGQAGEGAEELADKMLEAINYTAWDTTRYVRWSFQSRRNFVWDRKNELVEVKWDDNRVIIETPTLKGMAWTGGELLSGKAKEKSIEKAWEMFCNDSFWLNAPAKVRDPGTVREIVDHDGKPALKVTYSSGGVTPGDSYLWILDENGLPTSWKMWVSIIPVGGVEATWENWIQLESGALISTLHTISGYQSVISDVYGSVSFDQLGLQVYPFEDWHATM